MDVENVNELQLLADKYGSDKGSVIKEGHMYTSFYETLLQPLKYKHITLLEIGLKLSEPDNKGPEMKALLPGEVNLELDRGEPPSIKMWLEYFEKANIIGFDITNFTGFKSDRFKFVQGDQGNDHDLSRLCSSAEQFDVVIDDGSHLPYHQQNTIKHIWNKLSPGGYYIIEDLHWQPSEWVFNLPKQIKTEQLFYDAYYNNIFHDDGVLPVNKLKLIIKESEYITIYKSGYSRGKAIVINKKK